MSYLLFFCCVALSAWVQGLTGFAFSLVLLGLSSLLQLAPIADAANAATLLSLSNGLAYFHQNGFSPERQTLRRLLPAGMLGLLLGVLLLAWLSSQAVDLLRALLGLSIVCAALLLWRPVTASQPRGKLTYALSALLSGLMGGLFSAAGPPLVYLLYREPLSRVQVRQLLQTLFACTAAARAVLVLLSGSFSRETLWLFACTLPAVLLVNRLQPRLTPALSARRLQQLVALLLAVTGAALLARSAAFQSLIQSLFLAAPR